GEMGRSMVAGGLVFEGWGLRSIRADGMILPAALGLQVVDRAVAKNQENGRRAQARHARSKGDVGTDLAKRALFLRCSGDDLRSWNSWRRKRRQVPRHRDVDGFFFPSPHHHLVLERQIPRRAGFDTSVSGREEIELSIQ